MTVGVASPHVMFHRSVSQAAVRNRPRIVFLFWHMNLHYMNIAFAALGYRVYTTEMKGRGEAAGNTVILLSKRTSPPATGVSAQNPEK
jgi:hypothetical protein